LALRFAIRLFAGFLGHYTYILKEMKNAWQPNDEKYYKLQFFEIK
jgi:hypothetical protein